MQFRGTLSPAKQEADDNDGMDDGKKSGRKNLSYVLLWKRKER